jgi:rhamnosyltransferase
MADNRSRPAAVPRFAVVIPTLNACRMLEGMLDAVRRQTAQPCEVLAVDSESGDGTPELCRRAGWRVHPIAAASFDHGATRNLGAGLADAQAEIVLFLTQDAIPARPDAFARLIEAFADPQVAVAYGRQLPRRQAGAMERHARLFNYPSESAVKRLPEARALGIKAVFVSNSFAAYRRSALAALGGFPAPAIMGEDQVFAARALLGGWSVAYVAQAEVVHSHGYTPLQEFRRYFDIGVYHAAFPVIGHEFGGVDGEGAHFVRSEVGYLARHAPHLAAAAPVWWAAKYLGYRLGRAAQRLPRGVCLTLAMHKGYFRSQGEELACFPVGAVD